MGPANNSNPFIINDYLYKYTIIQHSVIPINNVLYFLLDEHIYNGSNILLSDITFILELIKVTNNGEDI